MPQQFLLSGDSSALDYVIITTCAQCLEVQSAQTSLKVIKLTSMMLVFFVAVKHLPEDIDFGVLRCQDYRIDSANGLHIHYLHIGLLPVKLFPKLNDQNYFFRIKVPNKTFRIKCLFGYFDPVSIVFDNKNEYFPCRINQGFG